MAQRMCVALVIAVAAAVSHPAARDSNSLQTPPAKPAAPKSQVKAQLPAKPILPAWDKGILPISRESYYNAIECGKQGGDDPACVFWDTGLCKNDDFTLAFYSAYKQVAYEVWQAVSHKQAAPTPSYVDAQKTRVTVGVTAVRGSKNPIAGVVIRRGSTTVKPATQSVDENGGRFIFDYAAFAPTTDITLDLVGRTATQSCTVDRATLARFR
jgi:hypothetical protein